MKKIFLSIAAMLLVLSASVSAQKSIDWGVKAGLNLATLSKVDDYYNGDKMKPSIHVGVFARFELADDIFWVQPELQYSRQGFFSKVSGDKMWYRLNYLNVPIIFKLKIVDNLTLDLGPQFGYLLNGKAKFKIDGDDSKNSITDGLKKFDFTIAGGLTYAFNDIDISARYGFGLTKTHKDAGDLKNRVIQIGLGYRF